MADETVFDTAKITEIIPHRYPFLYVDRIVGYVENQSIVAIKNVSVNEPFFQGHFPGRPIMPGVLIIEAMAQASAILAKTSKEGIPPEKMIYLVGANDFKWKRPVVPGDVLRIEMTLARRRRPFWVMNGRATVDGKLVCEGSISAAETD